MDILMYDKQNDIVGICTSVNREESKVVLQDEKGVQHTVAATHIVPVVVLKKHEFVSLMHFAGYTPIQQQWKTNEFPVWNPDKPQGPPWENKPKRKVFLMEDSGYGVLIV